MRSRVVFAMLVAFAGLPMVAASANVITDWDEIGVKTVQPVGLPPPINPSLFFRAMAMMHVAMFNAVNAIEPRYQPYKFQVKAEPDTSEEAAAASAAASVLLGLVPNADVQTKLTSYLATIPDGEAKERGVRLGEDVASKMLALRADDGSKTPNAYRPVTQPGIYVPTAVTIGWESMTMTPFAMTSPSQFRPGPPPDLKSELWAKDYDEIKELGEKHSAKRTARQTEDARFWLTTGPLSTHSLERQIVIAENMSVPNSARFMAMVSIAEGDAIQSAPLKKMLAELSQASGGLSYEARKSSDIEQIFKDISQDLQHLYLISYKPPAGPGAGVWRRIAVALKNQHEYRIRSKEGYTSD